MHKLGLYIFHLSWDVAFFKKLFHPQSTTSQELSPLTLGSKAIVQYQTI